VPGRLRLGVRYAEPDDPLNFAFVELWDSREHYERYFVWRQEQGVLQHLSTMVDGEAIFRFFDIVGL
jgi:quinol monooxygenase YgiN